MASSTGARSPVLGEAHEHIGGAVPGHELRVRHRADEVDVVLDAEARADRRASLVRSPMAPSHRPRGAETCR